MVEFLKDRKGDERKAGDPYIKELDIAPQSGAYLKILFNNPVTYQFKDLGKITVPSMPAFLASKLVPWESTGTKGRRRRISVRPKRLPGLSSRIRSRSKICI